MVWSGSLSPRPLTLAPHFVNNGYIITELTYSTTHVHHVVPTWPQAMFVLYKYINPTWEDPFLLLPREKKCVCSSYDSLCLLSASLLQPCLPWVQKVHIVRYSKTIGVVGVIRKTRRKGGSGKKTKALVREPRHSGILGFPLLLILDPEKCVQRDHFCKWFLPRKTL